jgi:hypothetical protein
VAQTYFQKGFGLDGEVGPLLARSYHREVVDHLKTLGFRPPRCACGLDPTVAARRRAADLINAGAVRSPA